MEKAQAEPRIPPELHIQLLGRFAVSVGKETIPDECWRSRRARSLVKLLALAPSHRLHRDQIIDSLWAASDLAAAANNFHQTLHAARRILGAASAACLALEDGFLSLAQAHGQTLLVDIDQFEAAADRAKSSHIPQDYQTALAMYKGDLLPDDLYEEWTLLRRETLRDCYLQLLLDLARLHETRQEYPQGIEVLQRLLSVDPSREEAHAGLMRLFALSGQRQLAIRQYQALRESLSKDLEAEPSPGTTQLYEAIQSGRFSPELPKARPVHNLPEQLTSYIGREKEIATLKQIVLDGKSRLVTITGAGGVGKTRLALRLAEELLEAFPDGVWLVELAAITNPDLVPVTVASALNLRESPDQSILEKLVVFVRPKRMLIVLDNCEHLVAAVAGLADRILHACAHVIILITSREILGVSGEMPFRCPSLSLPDPPSQHLYTQPEPHTALAACEAVCLFAERAAVVFPAFEITQENASSIAQVCRQLDGIPLAIELAAARTRLLSIEQIAERLDHTFLFLTGGSRTALPRHQTLKATVDWSYNLLAPAERLLLLRLSIFSGGWTLEEAEAVCSGEDPTSGSLQHEEILDLLGRLADKSLVLVEPGPRYRMLETVRQYAYEHLLETGGDALLRERHLACFLDLAEQAEPHLRAWGMVDWLNRLEKELGNLRLALEWSLTGSIEQGLRLASALYWFWHLRGRRLEGIQWLERLLDAVSLDQSGQDSSTGRRIVLGKALIVVGDLNNYYPGVHHQHACLQFKEGKAIFRELGDQGQKYLPFAIFTTESFEEFQEGLALARKIGNQFYTAEFLWVLGIFLIKRGDLKQARVYYQENLAIRQKIGDVDGEAFAYYHIGELEFFQGNLQRAIELWDASRHCFQAVGNIEFSEFLSWNLLRAALARGDYQSVLRMARDKLAVGQEISSSLVVADALGHISWAYWALKEYDQVGCIYQEFYGPDWENNLPAGRKIIPYVLGRIALSRGDYARAGTWLHRAIGQNTLVYILAIQALGVVANAMGQPKRSVVIFGALDGLFGWVKNVTPPVEQTEYEQALNSARDALGDAAFQSAWAEGQAMTSDQMMAFVNEAMDLE